MSNIALSPEHGLNPTIPVCFFCGKEKNEIVILGKLKGDAKAPQHAVVNYEPCDECKTKFEQGVLFIAVTTNQPSDERGPIQKDKSTNTHLYPTGEFALLKREGIDQLPIPQELKNASLQTGKMLIDEEAFHTLFGQLNENTEETDD